MCNQIEIKIAEIIKTELEEMVENILEKHGRNQANRENNPFNCFLDPHIKAYMGMGRSFDSQLGNRLQNIAFRITRLNENKAVPNRVIFNIVDKKLYMHCKMDGTLKQTLYVGENGPIEPQAFSVEITPEQAVFYKSLTKIYKNKNGWLEIPVDLLYLNIEKGAFRVFEIKAGGNLDTKNAAANYNEVCRLKEFFSPLGGIESYFATCYHNTGEGAAPQGSIFARLPKEQILVGKDFWKKVLPKEVTYKRFIEIYQDIFQNVVQVDRRLQV